MAKEKKVEEPKIEEQEIILTRFKIKKNGLALEYWTYEPMKKGNMVMNGEVSRKSPFPPTHEVLEQVNRLRYFFAKVCGMWYDGFDTFIASDYTIRASVKGDDFDEYTKAKNTIEAIFIDEVKVGDYYKIGASVQTMENKFIHTITPNINENDDIFDSLQSVINNVLDAMKEFIRDSKYDIKAEAYDIVFRSIQNKEERLEVMNSMTERDILLNAIEILENKGAMLMMDEELSSEIIEMKKERELEESVNEINGVEITSNDLGNISLEDAKSFAETETVHESMEEKNSDQDWAEGFVDDSENAKEKELIVNEFE